jgi:hypothetical protein
MARDLVHRAAFEQMGETAARAFAERGGSDAAEAVAWLAEQEALRADAAASKRDAREEETLSIAKEALANSRWANKIAISAIVLASTTTIIAAIIGVLLSSPK